MSWPRNPVVTDFFGYLAQFFFIFAVCLFAFAALSDFMPRQSPRWMRYERKWDEWRNSWIRRIKGVAQSTAVVVLFTTSCLGVLVIQTWRMRPNVVIEHNVVTYGQGDNGDWNYTSDEHPNGDTFRPCPEERVGVDGMLKQAAEAPPYIADYAKWEELTTCKSIARQDLGFFFKDRHNNFKYRRVGQ